MAAIKKVTTKICPSCAAEYEDTLPKCPYCGTLNYSGAEAEYFEKLEDVREDMEDLGDVPAYEMKKEFAKQRSFLKKILLILGVLALGLAAFTVYLNRDMQVDAKAEYRWKQEVFPILDELYTEKKYEELLEAYWEAAASDMPSWDWAHADFCDMLDQCIYLDELLEREAVGKELTDLDYTYLLYYGLRLTGNSDDELDEEEEKNLEPYVERITADFQKRWSFTDEEMEAIEKERKENYGHVSFQFCEEYIEVWLKSNGRQKH